MTAHFLDPIFTPASIAVAGASNNPLKMGTIQFLNLLGGGFSGKVFPLHPKEKKIFGHKAYPGPADLPQVPDLALLVVPTSVVPELLDEFGKIGTKGAIIISAGFKETGENGAGLEADLKNIAQKYNIRFIGPNCMGVINPHHHLNTTAAPYSDKPGSLGLISQSGTYVTQTLGYLSKRGIRFSKAVSVGNAANIDLTDCLEYLGQDKDTKAIGLYVECIRRPERFLKIARRISRNKPIVAQYVGGTDSGARSGASHTGAMAGPDYIYDGLFAQAGVIRVNFMEDMFSLGHALANQPVPAGRRVGILTNSGGPATAMADMLDKKGMELPVFSGSLQEKLRALLPGYASSANPVDLTFHVDMSLMTKDLPKTMAQSGEIDGLLIHGVMDTGWGQLAFPVLEKYLNIEKKDIGKLFHADLGDLVNLSRQTRIPLAISSFFGKEDHAVREFFDHGIPVFNTPEKAAWAMGVLYQYAGIKNRPLPAENPSRPAPQKALDLMKGATARSMDEHLAKQVLSAYGIPVVPEIEATDEASAMAAAEEMGFPVVVKVLHPEERHKTEKNLVKTGIQNREMLKTALDEILQNAPAGSRVLVCRHLGDGREFMAGMIRFPGFGPCILFGMGGIFAEVLADRVFRIPPFDMEDAMEMMDSIREHGILGSVRGKPAVDRKALARLLVRLGDLALNHPEIKEIDINPILMDGPVPTAADALFIL